MVSVNDDHEPDAHQPQEPIEPQQPQHQWIPDIFLQGFMAIFLLKIDVVPYPLIYAIGSVHKTLQNLTLVLNAYFGDNQNSIIVEYSTTSNKMMVIVWCLVNKILCKAYPRNPETNTLISGIPNEPQAFDAGLHTISNDVILAESNRLSIEFNNLNLPEQIAKAWAAVNISMVQLEHVLSITFGVDETRMFENILSAISSDMRIVLSRLNNNNHNVQYEGNYAIHDDDLLPFSGVIHRFCVDVTEEIMEMEAMDA